ncbi:MAG: hypothetical protein ACXADA_20550 [Candidatus Hodarchaeales archaeon]
MTPHRIPPWMLLVVLLLSGLTRFLNDLKQKSPKAEVTDNISVFVATTSYIPTQTIISWLETCI